MELLRLCLLFMAVIYSAIGVAENLELQAAYPISGIKGIQPSGLAYCGSRLLMVSDKHDDTIFELVSREGEYEAVPFDKVMPPEPPVTEFPLGYRVSKGVTGKFFNARFDWEDIACVGDKIYLLSESEANVLAVNHGDSRWLYPRSLFGTLYQIGFLKTFNAGLEGMAITPSTLYLAIERDPRGIMSVPLAGGTPTIVRVPDSPLSLPKSYNGSRSQDVTALLVYKDKLYSLERNYPGVCRRETKGFVVEHCWSFAALEDDPRFRFGKMEYGLAEGFAMVGDSLMVVYDTNETARETDKNDLRPLMFRFHLPGNW